MPVHLALAAMDDDSRLIDRGWDALPEYGNKSGDADEAVTVSISTTPGEWLVNTVDAVVVPMSMAELVDALRSHKLSERSLVWRSGMQEWLSIDRVPPLKLAARMASPAPSRPATATATPNKPPPKPLRAPPSAPAQATPQGVSRKSTLPFGLPPPGSGSRPSHPRPSSSPRAALPPAASKEEPDVLAVYARPAATVSFDLSPEQPLRAAPPAAGVPAHTLAPTTTDSAQRRATGPRSADLSVVAASQFREVQRSSKRLVWLSSLASAAAASLLTFWASRGAAPAARPVEPTPAAVAVPAAAPLPPPVVAPPEPSSAPVNGDARNAAPAVSTSVVAPKPKRAARARVVNSVPAPRAPRADGDEGAATSDPSAEPNPYDVKLDEEPPAAKSATVPHGSGLEAGSKAMEGPANGSTSPGF